MPEQSHPKGRPLCEETHAEYISDAGVRRDMDKYRKKLTEFHNELLLRLETAYEPGVIQVVLERDPNDDRALPLADIRRNVRRMAALLQRQVPDLFIDKKKRQPMPVAALVPSPSPSPRTPSPASRATTTARTPQMEVFVRTKADLVVEEEEEIESLPPLQKTPRNQKSFRRPIVSDALPDYKNVKSSVDAKGKRTKKSDFRILQHEKMSSFGVPQGRYKQDMDYNPARSQKVPAMHSDPVKAFKPWEPVPTTDPPPKQELPKLSTDRLKNLVSRDFSKPPPPPTSRPDPRQQQLAKPVSKVQKPIDIFKNPSVKVNKSMNNMIEMTNYGEAEKPDPVKSKPKAPPKEEEKKKAYEVPKALKRAIAPPKLPPIVKPKEPPPSPEPSPESSVISSPSPDLIKELPTEPEISFFVVKDEFDDMEESEADSAYCTCDDYITESEDLKSRLTDDGTMSSSLLTETCTHCGGKRTRWSSRVPSSIKEQSSNSYSPCVETPTEDTPEEPVKEVSVEEVEFDVFTPREEPVEIEPVPAPTPTPKSKPKRKTVDILAQLDDIGQFTAIPDPEPEPELEPELPRTIMAPKKRQRGVYKDGAREQYIKALAAAEVRRLPEEPWMMLGPRISRAWVFSYFTNIPRPTDEPKPKKVESEEPQGKKKKKKKKRFRAMKHIFGKGVNYDSYFPGMKNNLVLAPITLPPKVRKEPPLVPYSKPGQLDPLRERSHEKRVHSIGPDKNEHPLTNIETPAQSYRHRNHSRLSSSHSHSHQHGTFI